MAQRNRPETIQVGLRLKEPLRAALENAASQRGVSMNAEIVRRLEASFEQAGGPEVQELTRLWQAAFLRGLGLGARALGLPEQEAGAALRDPFGYRTAVHAGTDALLAAQPKPEADMTPEQMAEFQRLTDMFAGFAARGAAIKVTKGDEK
jgi:hypothetical protein